jgi:excinuclease ABC subunit A
MGNKITIRGAREHNLKNINIDIPRDSLVIVTGVSGSGKSSLAFDTLFQEGQRKYVESLSAYARQFIGTMKSPDVDLIQGLSPTISIDQKTVNRNPRSTVGTVTEIWDHYRLLFARLGQPECPKCGKKIAAQTIQQIADGLMSEFSGKSCLVMAPIIRDRKGEYRKELRDLQEAGFLRVRINGSIHRLDEGEIQLDRYVKHNIEVIHDRLHLEPNSVPRLREAMESALKSTKHTLSFLIDDSIHFLQSTEMGCPGCRIALPELEPRLFSFNTPQGECPKCKGLGRFHQFDESLVIPDPTLSINKGAIKPQMPAGNIAFSQYGQQEFEILASHYKFSLDTPWNQLSAKAQKILKWGSEEELRFSLYRKGPRGRKIRHEERRIRGFMEVLQRVWDKWHIPMYGKYMNDVLCPVCHGTRLNPLALAVKFHNLNIDQICKMSVKDSQQFFKQLKLSAKETKVGSEIFSEIKSRLGFLLDVGLGYLTLDRSSKTLSGGEAQRIRLASQVGAGLQGVLYILDEPSIGLHSRDNSKLLDILERLRDMGNSLVVVEHDEETMRRADQVIDIGPQAGINGGEVLAAGNYSSLLKNPKSLTGKYLSGRNKIAIPDHRRPLNQKYIEIFNAKENNLKGIDVAFPLNMLVVVTGVSGSGKSTLINNILRKKLGQVLHNSSDTPGAHDHINGIQHIDKVIEIDQSPIGRTPRSNPATYTKIFDDIRDLFASLPESKIRGYSKGRFSFNVKGGRCEECEGSGVLEVEMQILSNVVIPCEACDGHRFNPATLEIHFKGKSISEILDLSFDQAYEFFKDHPKISGPIAVLQKIGLGYLKLGQPSTTLSGGEAQRMKISSELRRSSTGNTLYLLDEPTTGLHFEDIRRLLVCLNDLIDLGNSMIVIEHNLDVIKSADYVIDLGPEGGDAGGYLICSGTPEEIVKHPSSETAKYLKPVLNPSLAVSKPYQRSAVKVQKPDIQIKGAKKHNLKNIDVRIPHNKMTVITGVSGSGKSTLAFHTLFSEGQRRFVESLSTYARRFLGRMDRGNVDSISGLAPSIAVDQGSSNRSPRSTVATITELYDYFRLLWARTGHPHCVWCGDPTQRHSILDVWSYIAKNHSDQMVEIAIPLFIAGADKKFLTSGMSSLHRQKSKLKEIGFNRLRIDGKGYSLTEIDDLKEATEIFAVQDIVKVHSGNRNRIIESLELAYDHGKGVCAIFSGDSSRKLFSLHHSCVDCGYYFQEDLDPKNFSFNSHWGACDHCHGFGTSGKSVCPSCNGEKLKPAFSAIQVGDISITKLCQKTVSSSLDFFKALKLSSNEKLIAQQLLIEIGSRLEFLMQVGLDYIQLDRNGDTLSGGEAQRIRLSSQIGSGLEGVLYVLDEPTVGLHQSDTKQLINTLYKLRDLGNTLVIVEHDKEFIESADHIIEMGPGAGEFGGTVLNTGTVSQMTRKWKQSSVGAMLKGNLKIQEVSSSKLNNFFELKSSTINNLKGHSAKFPISAITAVTGVSGSGKSTLINDCLLPLAQKKLGSKKRIPKEAGLLECEKFFDEVLLIDQSPLSNSPRSTPASYTKILDKLRTLYASLPESKVKGFGIGRFSYNKKEGRCPVCEGRGFIFLEMHFLSDVWEKCEACNGHRYNTDTLSVLYRGKSIADVLNLRVSEAIVFFENHPGILSTLNVLNDIGLGYLRLGQATNTFSGGEAQRMKLAGELAGSNRKKSLYLLDEPSTGLHLTDIQILWKLMQKLVQTGNTVVFIEHQLDMIMASDWVVDLGPAGGDKGGEVLFQGTPQNLLKCTKSLTAKSFKSFN